MTSPARSLSLLAAAVAVTLAVTGCASSVRQPRATYDRINSELDQARASLANGGERGAATGAASAALLPPLDLSLPKAAEIEPRFDLAVSNAPAQSVFVALVSGTRYSMLVSPEVSGTLTVNLKDVTVREALEAIREIYGYDFRIQGTRVYVHPNTMQTRLFKVNYLVGRRVTTSNLRVNSTSITTTPTTGQGGVPGGTYPGAAGIPGASGMPGIPGATGTSQVQTDAARVLTTTDNDFWKELNTALTTIIGNENGRSVVVNGVSGVVLVRGMPQDLRNVEQYLKATQLIIERQVMLEAKIIDVTLSDQSSAGINWSVFAGAGSRLSSFGAVNPGNSLGPVGQTLSAVGLDKLATGMANGVINPTATGNGFFGLAFQTKSFAALLNFLESQGDVQVLSSPRIAAVNNQKAVLKVGTDDYYVTNVSTTVTTSGSGSNLVTPTITLQPFFSGVALDVMPQIDEENNILLHVHPSVSNVSEKEKVVDLGSQLGTFKLPLASSTINETDSIVRVQDGNIVAIGGLMSQAQAQSRAGLPGTTGSNWGMLLGGSRDSAMKKRELVILIKPTIIQDNADWAKDLDDTRDRMRSLDGRRSAPASNGG